MTKSLPLLTGAALLAGVTAAGAAEPLKLTDAQMDGVTAAGGVSFYSTIFKSDDIHIKETVDVDKVLLTVSVVVGNSALAQGTADAFGKHTNAEAFSFTQTTPWSSEAAALSISQSDGCGCF